LGKKIDEAAVAALARIKLCEQRLEALHFAMNGLDQFRSEKEVSDATTVLHMRLYREMNDAYSMLFMFTNVGRNLTLQKEATRLAYKHFLDKRHAIMGYLGTDGGYEGRWYAKDEEEFRKEIEEAKTNAEEGVTSS
jgi:hypothetical protein